MNDIVDFGTLREAAKAKTTPQPANTTGDPLDALASIVERQAGQNVELVAALVAAEQTIARHAADIANLKAGFATIVRMLRKPETDEDGD